MGIKTKYKNGVVKVKAQSQKMGHIMRESQHNKKETDKELYIQEGSKINRIDADRTHKAGKHVKKLWNKKWTEQA